MENAASYDQWYDTARGRWIGRREVELILEHLQPRPGESLLDVGCGTGFFTRTLAASMDGPVHGVDISSEWVVYARQRNVGRASYMVADARALPYSSASFDLVVSIAAVCFIEDEVKAVDEIVRVARRRIAIGFLNRHSLLWLEKGRGGGRGGYRGAHWHTVRETKDLFRDKAVTRLRVRTAIQIPSGGRLARVIERTWPLSFSFGGFILAVGDIAIPTLTPPDYSMHRRAVTRCR